MPNHRIHVHAFIPTLLIFALLMTLPNILHTPRFDLLSLYCTVVSVAPGVISTGRKDGRPCEHIGVKCLPGAD